MCELGRSPYRKKPNTMLTLLDALSFEQIPGSVEKSKICSASVKAHACRQGHGSLEDYIWRVTWTYAHGTVRISQYLACIVQGSCLYALRYSTSMKVAFVGTGAPKLVL